MASPLIKIDQVGQPAGIAGQSRDDLLVLDQVTVTETANVSGTYSWTFEPPPDSGTSAAGLSTDTVTFTPDVEGTYLLYVDVTTSSGTFSSYTDDAIGQRVSTQGGAAVKLFNGRRIPGVGETLQFDGDHGWATTMTSMIKEDVIVKVDGATISGSPFTTLNFIGDITAVSGTQGQVDVTFSGGGGGGGSVSIEDEGVQVVSTASTLNFTGDGVFVEDAGGGEAVITISGALDSVTASNAVLLDSFTVTGSAADSVTLNLGSSIPPGTKRVWARCWINHGEAGTGRDFLCIPNSDQGNVKTSYTSFQATVDNQFNRNNTLLHVTALDFIYADVFIDLDFDPGGTTHYRSVYGQSFANDNPQTAFLANFGQYYGFWDNQTDALTSVEIRSTTQEDPTTLQNALGVDSRFELYAVDFDSASVSASSWELIAETNVTSNTTTIALDGTYDGNNDGEYLFEIELLVNSAGGTKSFTLEPNGATGTDQESTGHWFIGTFSGEFTSASSWLFAQFGNGDRLEGRFIIKPEARSFGRTFDFEGNFGLVASNAGTMDSSGRWDDTTTNITSWEISSSVASSILTGSVVRTYKRVTGVTTNPNVATKIYDGTKIYDIGTINEGDFLVAGATTISGSSTGGGGGAVAVQDEGSEITAAASTLNFVGDGVLVTDAGGGEVTITISGGGGGAGGGSSAVPVGPFELAPENPSAYDDEFDDDTLDTAKWDIEGTLDASAIDIDDAYTAATVRLEQNTFKASNLAIQVGTSGGNSGVSQQINDAGAAPTGWYLISFQKPFRVGAAASNENPTIQWSSTNGGLGDITHGIRVNVQEQDPGVITVAGGVIGGGTGSNKDSGDFDGINHPWPYIGFRVTSSTTAQIWLFDSHGTPYFFNEYNYTGGETLDRFMIVDTNTTTATPGTMISFVDFFRYFEDVDSFPYSAFTKQVSGGSVSIKDEGVEVTATATTLNFVGDGVFVQDSGSGEATITISGSPSAASGQGDYIYCTLSTDITANLSVGQVIAYDTVNSQRGDLQNSSGSISGLKAGRTYAITAQTQGQGSSSYLKSEIWDSTAAERLGSEALTTSPDESAASHIAPSLRYVFTPTVDTTIQTRVSEFSVNTVNILAESSFLEVTEITTISGTPSPFEIQDEGSQILSNATGIDFVGCGVTATSSGTLARVEIPCLEIKDEGTTISSAVECIDFHGGAVEATVSGGCVRVQIDGTGGGGGGSGTDENAIHDNVAGEISLITSKPSLVDGDYFILEDSESSDAKKSTTLGNIATSISGSIFSGTLTEAQITDLNHNDTNAIHINTADEFDTAPVKHTLVGADRVLIEDSEDNNSKKYSEIIDILTASGIASSMEFMDVIEVTSDVQDVDFLSGGDGTFNRALDGDVDDTYFIYYHLSSPGSLTDYSIQPDTSGGFITTNQASNRHISGSTTAGAVDQVSNMRFARAGSSSTIGSGFILFHAKSGKERLLQSRNTQAGIPDSTSTIWGEYHDAVWDDTSTKITGLRIHASTAGGITSGSRFVLYRQRAVPTAGVANQLLTSDDSLLAISSIPDGEFLSVSGTQIVGTGLTLDQHGEGVPGNPFTTIDFADNTYTNWNITQSGTGIARAELDLILGAILPDMTGNLWELIAETTVDSTVSSFEISNSLSLDTDEEWLLKLWVHSDTGTTHNTLLGLRGTFTDAVNYSSTMLRSDGTSLAAASDELNLCQTNSPDRITATVEISKRAGSGTIFTGQSAHNFDNHFVLGGRDSSTSDVTSLSIGSTATNRFLAGTEARLYRKFTGSGTPGGGKVLSGPAGGDLGGDYPDPTVSQARGLRESDGPTTLSMGGVSDGQILLRSGSSIIGVSRSALWEEIRTVHISSTVTSFTIGSSLDLDSDLEYWIQLRARLATGTSHRLRLTINGSSTDANWVSTQHRTDGASVENFIGVANELRICQPFTSISDYTTDIVICKRVSGAPLMGHGWGSGGGTGPLIVNDICGFTSRLTSNVTTIGITSSTSNRFLSNTEARLYRRVT